MTEAFLRLKVLKRSYNALQTARAQRNWRVNTDAHDRTYTGLLRANTITFQSQENRTERMACFSEARM